MNIYSKQSPITGNMLVHKSILFFPKKGQENIESSNVLPTTFNGERAIFIPCTLLQNVSDDAIAWTKFSTISLCLTKLFVLHSFVISSSVIHSGISFLTVYTVQCTRIEGQHSEANNSYPV